MRYELGGLWNFCIDDKKSDKYAQQTFEKTNCSGILGLYIFERNPSFAEKCLIFDP